MVEAIHAQTRHLLGVDLDLHVLRLRKQTSVVAALQIELLDKAVLVAKDSEVAALRDADTRDPDVEHALWLLDVHLGDAVVGIAPEVRLSSPGVAR